jgi:predicted nucleotidyltransferase
MESAFQNRELFEKISLFLKKEGATKIAIFGSYARGEERPESDIDVLVEFPETKGLLTMVRIERELSEFLGVKVDLLTEGSISPYLIEGIKKEAKVISA